MDGTGISTAQAITQLETAQDRLEAALKRLEGAAEQAATDRGAALVAAEHLNQRLREVRTDRDSLAAAAAGAADRLDEMIDRVNALLAPRN